jgi:hypothetical protein
MDKINLDYILQKLHKKQKYLMGRFLVLVFIVMFSFNPILKDTDVSKVVLLNTVLLLILPIFLDYFLGLDTYNFMTNLSRIVGFLFSVFIIFMCIVGYMGGFSLSYDENNILKGINLNGTFIDVFYLKLMSWIIPTLAFVDFVGTLRPSEILLYSIQDQVNKEIKSLVKEAKKNNFREMVDDNKRNILEMLETVKHQRGVGE